MKTVFGIRRFALFASLLTAAVVLVSCVIGDNPAPIPEPILKGYPPIAFDHEGGVLVPRALHISSHDLERLNQTLAKYDKSLYQVKVYDHGKVTEVKGTARCPNPNAVKIVDEAAMKSGASNVAIQASVRYSLPDANGKRPSGGPTCYAQANLGPQAMKLSERVTAILKKYR